MLHRLRSLIEIDPRAATHELITAFRNAKCHYQRAAESVGCTAHTFTRWARLLGIVDQLDQIEREAKADEWHHGRLGGAGYHRDPIARVAKSRQTRVANRTSKVDP